MNKQDLELAKKIAVIEGVELTSHRGLLWCKGKGDLYIDGVVYKEYNPFDLSIGPLMVKYKIEICYMGAYVRTPVGAGSDYSHCDVDYNCESEIPRAILQCIVKANECKLEYNTKEFAELCGHENGEFPEVKANGGDV